MALIKRVFQVFGKHTLIQLKMDAKLKRESISQL